MGGNGSSKKENLFLQEQVLCSYNSKLLFIKQDDGQNEGKKEKKEEGKDIK